jgi:hypothetical protein
LRLFRPPRSSTKLRVETQPCGVTEDLSRPHCCSASIISNLSLTPGTRLGVYEVTAPIGEGGMGQVFRATDTKLKRQVAIKILPPSLAADHDRLARFQREAEVLASLNHPNIAAIYGLEENGGITALVMELVDGDDLSQRNFMYFGVVVVGLVWAAVAPLPARGMALALVGTAIAQVLVPFIALVFWKTSVAPGAAVPVIGLNCVFIVLFAISALLFRRAARTHEMPPT